jgi:hypothetical protein
MAFAPQPLDAFGAHMMTQSSKRRASSMRNHLGTNFTVWRRRHIWFWLLHDRHGNSLAIGTAATEAEAVGEACSSIEELTSSQRQLQASPRNEAKTLKPLFDPSNAALGWMNWWMSVAHLATDMMRNCPVNLVTRST